MAEGIILAAGKGSRSHTNKVLLTVNDHSLLSYAIRSMQPFVSKIYVVTGYYDQDIREHLKDEKGVVCIYNENHHLGMFSSVLKGVKQTDDDVFIIPADCPFVLKQTYELILQHTGVIRVPTYQNYKGHPIFIEKQIVSVLKNEDINSNLKAFRNRYNYTLVETDDEMILIDIDTIKDFEVIKKKGLIPNGN
jgi:molybdenum cofactor cytidylyltransferase